MKRILKFVTKLSLATVIGSLVGAVAGLVGVLMIATSQRLDAAAGLMPSIMWNAIEAALVVMAAAIAAVAMARSAWRGMK